MEAGNECSDELCVFMLGDVGGVNLSEGRAYSLEEAVQLLDVLACRADGGVNDVSEEPVLHSAVEGPVDGVAKRGHSANQEAKRDQQDGVVGLLGSDQDEDCEGCECEPGGKCQVAQDGNAICVNPRFDGVESEE